MGCFFILFGAFVRTRDIVAREEYFGVADVNCEPCFA